MNQLLYYRKTNVSSRRGFHLDQDFTNYTVEMCHMVLDLPESFSCSHQSQHCQTHRRHINSPLTGFIFCFEIQSLSDLLVQASHHSVVTLSSPCLQDRSDQSSVQPSDSSEPPAAAAAAAAPPQDSVGKTDGGPETEV